MLIWLAILAYIWNEFLHTEDGCGTWIKRPTRCTFDLDFPPLDVNTVSAVIGPMCNYEKLKFFAILQKVSAATPTPSNFHGKRAPWAYEIWWTLADIW